ncbi:MAG: hypothetical protein ACLUFK_07340 [Oscillospiraceae bacterium]
MRTTWSGSGPSGGGWNAEEEYRRALEAKAEELRRSGSVAGRELLRIEAEIAAEESRKKEIVEAIAAGSDALNTAQAILDELGDAEAGRHGTSSAAV